MSNDEIYEYYTILNEIIPINNIFEMLIPNIEIDEWTPDDVYLMIKEKWRNHEIFKVDGIEIIINKLYKQTDTSPYGSLLFKPINQAFDDFIESGVKGKCSDHLELNEIITEIIGLTNRFFPMKENLTIDNENSLRDYSILKKTKQSGNNLEDVCRNISGNIRLVDIGDGGGCFIWKIIEGIRDIAETPVIIKLFDNLYIDSIAFLTEYHKIHRLKLQSDFIEECKIHKKLYQVGIAPKLLACCPDCIIMENIENKWKDTNSIFKKNHMDKYVKKLKILVELGYFHSDLHDGNIMYNTIEGDDIQLYFIDFGNMKKIKDDRNIPNISSMLSKIENYLQ